MFKLVLSAGHGKNTAGKRCLKKLDKNQTREWTLNNRICDKIETKLKAYDGYKLLRVDDTTGKNDIALKNRTKSANNWGADFYLAVHHNAGVNGGSGGGIVAIVYTKPSAKSLEWQKALYNAVIKHTGLKGNRTVPTPKSNLHEVREPKMASVLLECGFMDSKTDVPIILTDKFADQVAEGCVEVIVKKAKLEKKIIKTETKTEPKKETVKKDNAVLNWQKAAIKDGFEFPKHGADGFWGAESEAVAKKAICKKRLIGYKNKNLTKIIQNAVGVAIDGKFGSDTKNAVIKFQKLFGLKADGVVGLDTWKRILGVK